MTALKEYARLESTGLWRPDPESQRREVGLSFGDATLVISDAAGRPLAHWSLPAIERLNGQNLPALYSPDPDGAETVEISDDLMIEAIETIRTSVAKTRAKPGRLRGLAVGGIVVATALVAVFWLPGALVRQTLTVVPPAKRSEIGATLLGHIQRVSGTSCRNPLGTAALDRLKLRVLGRDAPGQILVLPGDLAAPVYLPGGIILLDRAMVEEPQDPAAVAGHVLAAALGRSEADPLEPILVEAGLGTTLTLLTTGDIPSERLQAHVAGLIATPGPLPPVADLRAGFEQAQVPPGPWLAATAGRTGLGEFAADLPADVPPILTDSDWVSLQNICRG